MKNKLEKKINKNWTFRKVSDEKWLKAQVPGCVHTDLYDNKIIPDLKRIHFASLRLQLA